VLPACAHAQRAPAEQRPETSRRSFGVAFVGGERTHLDDERVDVLLALLTRRQVRHGAKQRVGSERKRMTTDLQPLRLRCNCSSCVAALVGTARTPRGSSRDAGTRW